MSSWALADLRREPWWPHLPERAQNKWFQQVGLPLVPLRDVATVLLRYAPIPEGIPVVRPSDIDPVSGSLLAQRLKLEEGLRLGDGLHVGDVLVARTGSRPCVLIDERHQGLAFSSGFLLVRPHKIEPRLLWGLLSSQSGIDARESNKAGSVQAALTPGRLGSALIPAVPAETGAALCSAMALSGVLSGAVTVDKSSVSTWCLRDLRDPTAWWKQNTDQADSTQIPLATVAQVRVGNISTSSAFGVPAADRVPVVDVAHVRERASAQPLWTHRDASELTSAHTVLVTRNEPFRVLLAPPDHAVAKDLLRIDLSEATASLGKALACFLSGPEGKRRLNAAASGVTIRHLTVRGLGGILLPYDWRAAGEQPTEPLSGQLQRIFATLETWR